MPRFWNLQTKFVAVLIVLLLGSLVAQSYVHEQGKDRLRSEVEKMAVDLANEVTQKVPKFLMVGVQMPQVVVHQVNLNSTGRAGGERRRPGKVWERVSLQMKLNTDHLSDLLHQQYEELQNCQNPVATASELFEAKSGQLQELANSFGLAHPRDASPPHDDLFGLDDGDRWMREIPAPRFWIAASGKPASTAPIVGAPRAAAESTGFGGITSQMLADATSQQVPAAVNLGDYTDRIDDILDEDSRKTLLSLLAIFLSGIGAAWFLGNRMTRPVHSLVEGFQRVADGDLETRVPERSRGEFGLLGRQFNAMVGRLSNNRQLQRELELRERVQHMGDLAAGVAHDVRNPLNAIHLNIGQIRDEFLPSGAEKQERFLRFTSDIQNEVERLNELVTNFLSLAQPSSGDREEVSPNQVVEDLGRLLDKEAASHNVTIVTTLDESLPNLQCNEQELRSAFLNVAMNAMQAMDGCEAGRLDVVTGQRPVEGDSDAASNAEVAISFIDTGCGIAADRLEQIFIPYFTTREGGTGLGMAISQRIAERYGGRIEVRSQVGEGTSVSFVFPTESAEPFASPQQQARGESSNGGEVA